MVAQMFGDIARLFLTRLATQTQFPYNDDCRRLRIRLPLGKNFFGRLAPILANDAREKYNCHDSQTFLSSIDGKFFSVRIVNFFVTQEKAIKKLDRSLINERLTIF